MYAVFLGAGSFYAYKTHDAKEALFLGGIVSLALVVCSVVTFVTPKDVGLWGAMAIITLAMTLFSGASPIVRV